MFDQPRPVPWRTILASVFVVVVTAFGIILVMTLQRILTWIVIAGFFAVILNPAVGFLQCRVRVGRGLAIVAVFIGATALFLAMMFAFIRPLVDQAQEFVDKFPEYVADAREGRGPVGQLVQRYNIDGYIEENRDRIQGALESFREPALRVLQATLSFFVALVTILVLTFLLLLEGPQVLAATRAALGRERGERVSRVAHDCARAISGYMAGNLMISFIAGSATFAFLSIVGVPFQGVLALWVAFADLIPLVGATLGAIPTIAVAFLYSVPAGIATVVFFFIYQQFENHVLQVSVMSRTVKLNPLLVLVSVLIGVELFGIVGALLAIPAGGTLQVIVRDLWDARRGQPKEEPTVGTDEVPISEVGSG